MADVTLERATAAPGGRLVVGIGELAVSNEPGAAIVTHALGSCVAVCVWDAVARVAGLVHVLLPDSRINPARAEQQPGAFADTGIPLLFRAAYDRGAHKARCRVRLVGGAEVTSVESGAQTSVGRRNVQAAKAVLWRNGVMVQGESVGGHRPRTVAIDVSDGRVEISSGRDLIEVL